MSHNRKFLRNKLYFIQLIKFEVEVSYGNNNSTGKYRLYK